MNRDCTWELLEDEDALEDGDERGSGCGERWGDIVVAVVLWRWAFTGRGDV